MLPRTLIRRSTSLLRRFFSTQEYGTAEVQQFEALLGKDNVLHGPAKCEQFSRDEGHFIPQLPTLVLSPGSVEEIAAALRVCHEHRVPLVPRGTGTGLEGGAIPIHHGVCMQFARLDRLLDLHPTDFDCTVEPGVTRHALNDRIKETGLFFSVDPGADASVCGMVGTSASGTTSFMYGTMKANVTNLQVVLADGRVLWTRGRGRRPFKSSAGLNLTELFVGSEGVLGVVAAACVRLHPRPQTVGAAVATFGRLPDAVEAVVQLRQMGLPLARLEFLDDKQTENCIAYSKIDLPVGHTIFLEFHCQSEEAAQSHADTAKELCESNNAIHFNCATQPDQIRHLWRARHSAYYSTMARRPGARGYSTDVCVPLSRLVEVVTKARTDLDQLGIHGTIVGHVGEGNFHCLIPTFDEDREELERVMKFSDQLVKHALDAGGTCTGEHGIGLGKRRYLLDEFGPVGLDLMRSIKQTLDPNNIMNPGKML